MSLISDPDYLIHSLRLAYLRNVDDPYGPRIISMPESYNHNRYILTGSLADFERWPELAMPSSPPITDDEDAGGSSIRPSGFPGATGLKHSQTIMGPGRSGALGLRVSAKRASLSKRHSGSTPRQRHAHTAGGADSEAKATDAAVNGADATKPTEEAVRGVQFVPTFKGAAEMEARRRVRMQTMGARRSPQLAADANTKPLPPIITENLDPEVSSSDEDIGDEEDSEVEEDGMLDGDDSEDDDFEILAAGDDMDDGDEFDPDFAATRTPGINSDSVSDIHSLQSGASNPSALSHNGIRTRSRLSPVRENRGPIERRATTHPQSTPESYFVMVTPPPPPTSKKTNDVVRPGPRHSSLPSPSPNPPAPIPEPLFTRQKVGPVRPKKSALSAILSASSSRSSNPFSELYAAISGRAESPAGAMRVQVFFPHAREPRGEAMDLSVRKDATVEEVLGFALWNYWEEGWLPKLDEGVGEEDPRLAGVGWILRITEDDGEVDEDFPPPDRTAKISKFNLGAYAVLEASSTQVQQNTLLESKIQRRPSRTMASAKKELNTTATGGGGLTVPSVSGPGTSALFGTTPILSSSLGPSSGHGPQIFLRIRLADTTETVHISTTIPVSAGMYMQEALDLVCRKRKLDTRDFALVLNDDEMMILIPLDRTVASLQGKRELLLVKKNMLHQMGIEVEKKAIRTTDPNASIFKRMSDVPDVQISAAMDYTAAYKKYTIYRKMPMLVARQERGLAIDGAYIHIMPSSSKARAVFDNGKTTSFHIKSVVACQQSTKSSSIFKLVVQHDNRNKRYDFEAESSKLAAEIVQNIRGLKTALERTGIVNRSRRSRQVV